MILVTGATGQLGRRIVKRLAASLPDAGAGTLAVGVREASGAGEFAKRGHDVREADFDHPETLARAFAGVERLVLIPTGAPEDRRSAQHRHVVEAAKAAGVGHVYYVSFLDADATSPSEFARCHADAEASLAESGIPTTLLRVALYADFLPATFAAALGTGVLQLPAGAGRVSYVSRDDLAEAIAAAVLAPRLERRLYELSGQTAHGYAEVAAKVGRAAGVALRYEPLAEAAYADGLASQGIAAWFAGAVATMYSAVAENRFARTTTDFAALVGHPPRSLDCLVAEFFGSAQAARNRAPQAL